MNCPHGIDEQLGVIECAACRADARAARERLRAELVDELRNCNHRRQVREFVGGAPEQEWCTDCGAVLDHSEGWIRPRIVARLAVDT